MTEKTTAATRSTFLAVEPQLYVTAIEAACDYYGERLGFTVAFVYGDPPYYAQVYRDGVQLNLRQVDRSPFAADFRAREDDALSATIIVGSCSSNTDTSSHTARPSPNPSGTDAITAATPVCLRRNARRFDSK